MIIDTNETLGQITTAHPSAARVFLRHRLDFCCGGEQRLADACTKKGLDPAAIAGEIADEQETQPVERWDEKPLTEVVQYILSHYHEPLRRELPVLIEAANRVERVHRNKPSCPSGLASCLEQLETELSLHMAKEEQVLFPAIVAGGRGDRVHMPIRMMMQEHDDHGVHLLRLRELTTNFSAPAEACATWRALFSGLEKLESELMKHIHLENSVLFPRALNV